tara:strand:- start:7277 stop:7435 length:159 start_codon:yes stop_codon:yes gene_type:complete
LNEIAMGTRIEKDETTLTDASHFALAEINTGHELAVDLPADANKRQKVADLA